MMQDSGKKTILNVMKALCIIMWLTVACMLMVLIEGPALKAAYLQMVGLFLTYAPRCHSCSPITDSDQQEDRLISPLNVRPAGSGVVASVDNALDPIHMNDGF